MTFLTILSHNIWMETGFLIGLMFLINVLLLGNSTSFMVSSFWIVIFEYFNAKKELTFFYMLGVENGTIDPERLSSLQEMGVLLVITFLFSFMNRNQPEEEGAATGTGMNIFSFAFIFAFIDINFFNNAFSAFFFLPFLGFFMYTEELTCRK